MNKFVDVLKDDKGYYFKLESLGYGREKYYKVNGHIVEAGKTYTSENEPTIEVYQSVNKRIKAKSLVDGVPDLSIDEYEKKKYELESKRVPDDYDEYKIFKNLEDEYEYKKFIRDYKLITNTEEELIQTLENDIKEKVVSNNLFIKLHRHLGKGIMSQAATYDRWGFYKHYTRKVLNDLGFEEVDSADSTKNTYKIYEYNTGMVNLYIEGKQIFDIKIYSISDDMQTVETKHEEDEKWIEGKINAYMQNSRSLPSVQDIIARVSNIQKQVSTIDCKAKSYDDYQSAMRGINSFLSELEKGAFTK